MGGFGCPCGSGVKDNTDGLPYKAQLISDQDWSDFQDFAAASKWNFAFNLVKATVYQCPSCSRLLVVEHKGKGFHTFVPEGESAGLLRSVRGEEWKRHLRAHWEDRTSRGWVRWGDTGTAEGDNGEVTLTDWPDVEALYHEVFRRLLDARRLRSAMLFRNGSQLHLWTYKAE